MKNVIAESVYNSDELFSVISDITFKFLSIFKRRYIFYTLMREDRVVNRWCMCVYVCEYT